jgi:hypothetical protein
VSLCVFRAPLQEKVPFISKAGEFKFRYSQYGISISGDMNENGVLKRDGDSLKLVADGGDTVSQWNVAGNYTYKLVKIKSKTIFYNGGQRLTSVFLYFHKNK